MARLGMIEDDEYSPEFGTLMIRDSGIPPGGDVTLLDEYATDLQPCGTFTRAGNGWLEGAAGDAYQRVQLEAHDDAPDDDRADWDDVVETPYRSATGALELTFVTGGSLGDDLMLSGPGLYRVRVARRDDTWRLQFWPRPEPPEPPRWFVRGEPVVRPPNPGWRDVLGYETDTLTSIIGQAGEGPVTIEQVDEWGRQHSRPADWLDEPLQPDPPRPPSTGHPDVDATAWQRHDSAVVELVRQQASLDEIAAQLGVTTLRTRRHLLAALVAARVIVLDEQNRYRVSADPPRAQDILDLPPDRVAALNRKEDRRFVSFASDIGSVAAWAGPAAVTMAELADRLLAAPDDVRAALAFAVTEQLLEVSGNFDGQFTLTVRPKRPCPSPTVNSQPAATPAFTGPEPASGAPPHAGIVTGSGTVMVWRDGVVHMTESGQQPLRAMESAYGIVLLDVGRPSKLIRPDGGVESLGTDLAPHGMLDVDGRLLAVVEDHHGRESWHRLHLIDLADNSRRTMPWDESITLLVLGIHDGAVYFQRQYPQETMRWEPGSPPEPLGYEIRQLDPISGTALAADQQGLVVISPDGTRQRMALDPGVVLVPGGQRLYSCRYSPPAVTLFEIPDGAGDPRVHWLPEDTRTSTGTPWDRPVWEDTTHLVLLAGAHWLPQSRALRLDIGSGEVETVPLPDNAARAMIIEPLIPGRR